MDVIVAIFLMGLFSIAAGDPPAGQAHELCSQFYFMNQYCTSQPRQTPTAVSHRHVRPSMVIKARSRRSPVTESNIQRAERLSKCATSMEECFSKWKNLTELAMDEMKENLTNERRELTKLKDRIKRKFSKWRSEADSEMERMKAGIASQKNQSASMEANFSKWKNEMKENLTNKGKDLEDGIERKFMRWSGEADSEMERMKAGIASHKNESASMEANFSKWKNLTEITVDEMKENLTNKGKEWQELKDQLDEMKSSLGSEMNKTSSFIANATKDLEEKIESKFTSWRMEAESDMRRVKAWIGKRNVSCDITFNGICYWTHVGDEQNVNLARAEEICLSKASIPAYFPNERVYNAVVEDVQSKIPSGRTDVYVWTGVTFDPNTGNVIHPSGDTYVKWLRSYPLTSSRYKTYTRVRLLVSSNPGSTNQGMYNVPPHESRHGVVCQIVV